MAKSAVEGLELAELVPGARVGQVLMPQVAARIFNTPLAIDRAKLGAIVIAIGPRLGVELPATVEARGLEAVGGVTRGDRSSAYDVVQRVAVVPLMGTMVKRNGGGVLNSSGLVGSEAMKEVLVTAANDRAVGGILLQIDSHGGEVPGTAELAALIATVGAEKPVWAIADSFAYSAAYWAGSAASRLMVAPGGGVGSVGILYLHVDESAALERDGVKVTAVSAGARKVDLAPWAPLGAEGLARLQALVDDSYAQFTEMVAHQRGMSVEAVRATEAGFFTGAEAVRIGFADGVATFDDVLAELVANVNARSPRATGTGGRTYAMKDGIVTGAATPPGGDGEDPAKVISLADHQKGTETARAEAAVAERKRSGSIMGLAKAIAMPRDKAIALAEQLVEQGASLEDAREAFVTAQARFENIAADGAEILGHTADVAALAARTPKLKSRDELFAMRRDAMLGSRVGGQGVHGIRSGGGGAL